MQDQEKNKLHTEPKKYTGAYLLKVIKASTFEELKVYKTTKRKFVWGLIISVILFISIISSVIFFTPVRVLIPGYPDSNFRNKLVNTNFLVDSLKSELKIRDQYILTIQQIFTGDVDSSFVDTVAEDKTYEDIDFSISREDSLLRLSVAQDEYYRIEDPSIASLKSNISFLHFFSPVKGYITNSYDIDRNHFGTDVVTEPDMMVKAVLDGVVICSTWSLEFGYMVYIQHENNLISVYKHNAALLKKTGSRVHAGEAIAVVGDSGELSTGPHLHFELWYNGFPLNAEEYINF